MNANAFQAIAGLVLASSICACASFPQGHYERLAQIVPGHSKEDVLRIAGRPGFTTRAGRNGELWIYNMPNAWDGRTEYDITFDARGVVTGTRALRDEG